MRVNVAGPGTAFHSLLQIKIGEDQPPNITVVGGGARGRASDAAGSVRGRPSRQGVIPAFPTTTYTPLTPFERPVTISTRIPFPTVTRPPGSTAPVTLRPSIVVAPASTAPVATTGVQGNP